MSDEVLCERRGKVLVARLNRPEVRNALNRAVMEALGTAVHSARLAVSDAARASEPLSEWQKIIFASDDAKEGAPAFLEKRVPVWKGR
jgi:enoyl-CoA hydratase/carnithine racemase